MEDVYTALVHELRILRKGRGLFVRQIAERVGPALRDACGVSDLDGPAEIRRKVAERLESAASGLPGDLRVALAAAFSLDREARLPFYQDRVRWAANRIHRDDRTARRRIDEGIDRVAELITSAMTGSETTTSSPGPAGWHSEELRVAVALDQELPEVFEVRRVVGDRDHVRELDLGMTVTVPRVPGIARADDELAVDVFHGGTLVRKSLESTDRFALVLALPEDLMRDERREVMLRYRIPRGSVMQPHFACVPRYRCDLFELRVRFGPDRVPNHIWRLADAYQRDVDDPTPSGDLLVANSAGEVRMLFRQLTPGRAYGLRWGPVHNGLWAH
jgi:hypothetical protein